MLRLERVGGRDVTEDELLAIVKALPQLRVKIQNLHKLGPNINIIKVFISSVKALPLLRVNIQNLLKLGPNINLNI